MNLSSARPTRLISGFWRGLLSLVLVVLALAVAAGTFRWLASLKQPPKPREAVVKVYNVDVFDVERRDLREIVSGFGTARPDREVVLSAQVSGEIVDVHPRLEVGEALQAAKITVGNSGESQRLTGDLLVRIDQDAYAERFAQAENQLEEDKLELQRLDQEEKNNTRLLAKAKTDFETFQKEYERVRELRQKGVASISELTRAMLELQQYEDAVIRNENEKTLFPSRRELLLSRLRTHQADRKLAEIDLGHTDVRPPFSGTLSEVMIERGQYVRVGDPLVRLTDIADVVIAVSLTLTDYAKIAEGIREGRQPAVGLAENETAPVRWRGLAARVAPEADESTRTVKIFVQVDNRLQAVPLLPGTFVHARVEGPILAGAIVVPRDALKSGKFYVARGERAEPREVTVLQTLQSLAVVEAGLTTGDQVILTNLDMIHAGAAVSVQSHRTLEEELRGQRVPVVQPVARREPQQPAFVPDESSARGR